MQKSTDERNGFGDSIKEKYCLDSRSKKAKEPEIPAVRRVAGKGFCLLAAVFLVFSQPVSVLAANTSQMEKEKREAQQKLDEANKKAKEAEAQRNAAQAQVSSLSDELTEILSEITLLEADIADKELQIQQAQQDYDQAKATEERQ